MSGPTPMTLGGHAFQALGFGYSDVSRSLETPWASIDVAQRMDALHWVGPKAEQITVKGALFPEEWGGLDTLDALRRDTTAGRIMTLATADGRIHGRYVCEGIDEERHAHDRSGMPRKLTYTIKLKLYTGGAAAALGRWF